MSGPRPEGGAPEPEASSTARSSPTRPSPAPDEGGGGISAWSIARPVGTAMLATVVLVLGVFFLRGLPLDLLPSIVYPQIRASVSNPGVDPGVLEETIAEPLEASLAPTEDLVRLETEIQEGRVAVNLHFSYGTDIDFALQDASKNLDRARDDLPEEAEPPSIFKFDPQQIPIYEVAFSSEGRGLVPLREWVEDRLRPHLLTVEGVASVDVAGGLEREIQVLLEPERLRSYGLTVAEITDALWEENQDVAGGLVGSSEREVVSKTAGKFTSVDEIRALPLDLPQGGHVPLSEVARVRDGPREQRLWARLDGAPAVKLSVRKQPNANTVQVADGVSRKLAGLSADGFVPADIRFRTLQDQSRFIRDSLDAVKNAALAGAILAMIVVALFLGSLRKTFVVGLAIPLAVLATFGMMGMGGLTLNIMSLGGLALGVGLLVDNSIVMLENIFRHRDELGEEDAEEAGRRGAAEVQSAVVAATATNLAAVTPFLLISGLASLIFEELILTISFAILASLAVALTVVPMLGTQLARIRFSSGLGGTRLVRAFDTGIRRLRSLYRVLAPRVVRRRWWVMGGAAALLALSVGLTRGLGNEFLPQVDDGNVAVRIALPPGAAPQETNRIALELEEMLEEMPDVEHVFTTAGGWLWGGSTSERAGRGSIDVKLAPVTAREMSADEWVQRFQDRVDDRGFAGAQIFVRPPRIRGLRTSTSGSAIALTIQGQELDELRRIGEEVMARLEGVPGLENLEPSTEEASPELSVELDRERAAYLGLSVEAVGRTLRTALDGTVATRYTEENQEYDVRVRLPEGEFRSAEDLRSVALFPARGDGAPVYLRDVARVRRSTGPTEILRENQNRILRLTGDVLTEVAPVGVVNDSIRARLAGLELPDGYGILYGGEEESIRENNRQLATVVFLALFLVFVVMAVQYESFVNPLVILLAAPLSLIGVGMALRLTGLPLSAPVLLGVILLAGIVVNNAILLVEYMEMYRSREGFDSLERAVVEAGSVRLRPILMTTLTTGLGMLPLALGIGQGTELMQPLAVAVVGGLTVSMALTLFVVPAAYVAAHRGADRLAAWLTGRERRVGRGLAEPAAAMD